MKQLIQYLLENLILDFQGDLTLDMVRDFLRDDESREGRALLGKLVEDRGVSDMMITLADCLQDYLKTGINDETLREQIQLATMRYSGGVSSYLEVLDTERQRLTAEQQLAQAQRDVLISLVQLYKALGGGWQ